MMTLTEPRVRYFFPCQRCIGGVVLRDWCGYFCVNCGQEHDEDGELIVSRHETSRNGGGRHQGVKQ